ENPALTSVRTRTPRSRPAYNASMIKHVRITGFKSLETVSVHLDPVTVLIGRSGTGKSNFVEALRFLRDYLTDRDEGTARRGEAGWHRVVSATASPPKTVAFSVTFTAPGISGDYEYLLTFQQLPSSGPNHPPQFRDEMLSLGGRVLFRQQHDRWIEPPPLMNPPSAGTLMLGALTGIQEVTIAYLVLTNGIGCYAFPDDVLTRPESDGAGTNGLADNGDNFLQAFTAICVNLKTWHHLRDMAASLRSLKASLKSIDLQLPQRQHVVVTHEFGGRLLVFDLNQESEGFRRLLACLIALYQEPPKETLIFDEPEKRIYPV